MRRFFPYSVVLPGVLLLLSSCQKEISFETGGSINDSLPVVLPPPSSPTLADLNTWQFIDSDNGSLHHGFIDTLNSLFDIKPMWNYLRIVGWPANSFGGISNDTMFLTVLFLPHPFIEPGIYDIASGIGGDHVLGFGNNTIVPPYGSNQNFCYYIATPDIAPDFKIHIISFDSDRKFLKGNFSGRLRRRASITDYSVTYHTISGSFYLRLNY